MERSIQTSLDLSIVLPVYNEEDNVEELHRRLTEVLGGVALSSEVLYVDDGSTDGSLERLRALEAADARVRVLALRRNFGQTQALAAGIAHSRGRVIVTMDADLQNDPADIPRLLARLEEGYDVVSGWRRDRQDARLLRVMPSRMANALISWGSGLRLHDYGCTLKAYRRWVFENLPLYGEMHRFIAAWAHVRGARVAEMVVAHHPRTAGVSKYGLNRTFKVLLDLTTLMFLKGYATKPIYVFGGASLACLLLSGLAGAFVAYRRLAWGGEWISPMFFVAFNLFAFAVQFILLGLVAEMIVRAHHEASGRAAWEVVEPAGLTHAAKADGADRSGAAGTSRA